MEFKTKIALVFSGQGSQYIGMARELYNNYSSVRDLFVLASDVCSLNMKTLLFESSNEQLKQTINTQPAVTLASLSAITALREHGLKSSDIAWLAGFSLGEYAMLVVADVLTVEETFLLVYERGRIMHHAGLEFNKHVGEPGMAAVIGLSSGRVKAVLNDQDEVYIANYNAPDQVVISGLLAQIDRLTPLLKEAGAQRIIKLSVSGPFHTPLLANASLEFRSVINNLRFANPKLPMYSNVTGALLGTGSEVQNYLSQQISHPVLWQSIMADAKQRFAERVMVEVGPGKVLSGLMRSNGGGYEAFSCMSLDEIDKLMLALK